jgi:hypothetical protein
MLDPAQHFEHAIDSAMRFHGPLPLALPVAFQSTVSGCWPPHERPLTRVIFFLPPAGLRALHRSSSFAMDLSVMCGTRPPTSSPR